ncbi:MAG: hypothetical protein NTV09_05400 [Bacteroidetes bacterium]|nr:hypothetical protein [Bacteroidota bacterium]
MKHLLPILFIFCSLFSIGQNPLVKMWDYRYGGANYDYLTCIAPSSDGGCVLGGYSRSQNSGDKTQGTWGLNDVDYWIVKLDSLGIKQWDRDFGGIDDEVLTCLQQTPDGGYIIGGYSSSGISGNKTQDTWGGYDYWILKLDFFGTIQWEKSFGGLADELMTSIAQTSDGGYILGGYSTSGISGDKTEDNWDPGWVTPDYWVVKIDSLGNKQWDKDFGGLATDQLQDLKQTSDGGYILAGSSDSPVGGNKTQPAWGFYDYWIVKLDATGNKQWDLDFGGDFPDLAYSLVQTNDNGFVIAGVSSSVISGNKAQPCWGGGDYWIIKMDFQGNKLWEKVAVGTGTEDEFGNVFKTTDGGFLFSGTSYSNIGGDKTENNLSIEQTWVIKTDSLGIQQWDKTLHTLSHDENTFAVQSADGCFIIGNRSDALSAGDKTQSPQGLNDYWITKYCDSTFNANFIAARYLCPGTCTNFLNISTNAGTYQWSFQGAIPDTSTAINPTNICYAAPGSYDVQLIASNANGSDTLLLTNYITVYTYPPPQSITQSGDTLFAVAGSASYQWYFNGNSINGATDYFYVAQASGDYNVVATDANGCEVEAAVFNVVALVNAIEDQEILIFPNPVEEKVTIQKNSHRDFDLQCTR